MDREVKCLTITSRLFIQSIIRQMVNGRCAKSQLQLAPMAINSVIFFLIFLACYREGQAQEDYNGYQLWRINSSPESLQNISRSDLDIWSSSVGSGYTDICVGPEEIKSFGALLNGRVSYDVVIANLSSEINHPTRVKRETGRMNWRNYQRLSTILKWMNDLERTYPSLVKVMTIGHSSEGRPIRVMKISSSNRRKPAVWIDGGIHGREWISPATVTYIMNVLVSEARSGDSDLVKHLDFYFAPVVNPDGYEYTGKVRLWRKSRSSGSMFCRGVDLNRNWDFNWGGKGASGNSCNSRYRGPSPASEPEVQAIQDFVMDRKDMFKLFISTHSYSQLIVYPYGTDKIRMKDERDLAKMASRAAYALENVHGTRFEIGPQHSLVYDGSGMSIDWAKAMAGIKFSFVLELRDKGRYGFLLPPNQIIPSGQETLAAVRSMANDVIDYYRLRHYESPEYEID